MSDHLRHAIRDGQTLSEGKRQMKRAAAYAALEYAADELNAGRVPPGVIVCRRGKR